MNDRTYTHIFLDQTENGGLSNAVLKRGVKSSTDTITNGAKVAQGASSRLQRRVDNRIINPPLDAVTGGLWTPARQIASGIQAGKMAMVGAGVTVLAWQAVEFGIQKIQERIAKLEAEARQANDIDNLLIRSGSFNIKDATVSYGRRGRAQYKYNKG